VGKDNVISSCHKIVIVRQPWPDFIASMEECGKWINLEEYVMAVLSVSLSHFVSHFVFKNIQIQPEF
jgi:hypothetical protein